MSKSKSTVGKRCDVMMSCRNCMSERRKNTLWVLHGTKSAGGITLDNEITDPNDPKQDPTRCPECGAPGGILSILEAEA